MTEAKIKTEQIVTPVTYEPISKAVWNARGGLVCKVDEHDANFDTDESIGREQWDELCDEVGFHIANALNRQSELEKRVVHLETVLTATKPLIDAEPQIDDLLNRSGKLLSEVKIKKLEAEAHESAIRTAAEVKVLREANQWIPVSERLPDFDGEYLATIELPQECGNVWIRQRVEYCGNNVFKTYGGTVIAWMPLPKPYQALAATDTARGDDDGQQ